MNENRTSFFFFFTKQWINYCKNLTFCKKKLINQTALLIFWPCNENSRVHLWHFHLRAAACASRPCPALSPPSSATLIWSLAKLAAAAMSSSTRMWYGFIPGNHSVERSRESALWIWANQGRTVDRHDRLLQWWVDWRSKEEVSSSLV